MARPGNGGIFVCSASLDIGENFAALILEAQTIASENESSLCITETPGQCIGDLGASALLAAFLNLFPPRATHQYPDINDQRVSVPITMRVKILSNTRMLLA